jgi:hypothetical protein
MADQDIQKLHDRIDQLSDLVKALSHHTPQSNDPQIIADVTEDLATLQAQVKGIRPGITSEEVDRRVKRAFNAVPSAVIPPIKARFKDLQQEIGNAKGDLERVVDSKLHTLTERAIRSEAAHEAKGILAAEQIRSALRSELKDLNQ